MRTPYACIGIFLLAILGCGSPEPAPIIFGIEAGTVTTEEQELVPLEHYREPGYTQVMFVPVGHPNPDTAGMTMSMESRMRAVASGTYAQGIEPEVIITPNDRVGNFMGNNIRLGGSALVRSYDDTTTDAQLSSQLQGEFAGKRVVLVATIDRLESIAADAFPEAEFTWPAEGENGLIFLSSNGTSSSVQPFAIVTEWEE